MVSADARGAAKEIQKLNIFNLINVDIWKVPVEFDRILSNLEEHEDHKGKKQSKIIAKILTE